MPNDQALAIPFESVATLLAEEGLALVGIASRPNLDGDVARLVSWQQAEYAGSMSYMLRDGALFGDFDEFLPDTKTVLVVATYYSRRSVLPCPRGFGRVARYAWGRDYHKVLKKRLLNFSRKMTRTYGEALTHRSFTDAVPLLERALARESGLGFIGKNTMLIRPGEGSFCLLGEVLLNVGIDTPPRVRRTEGRCGPCRRCLDSCPTGAFPKPYVLDARRCIAYHTIESRDGIPEEFRPHIGSWLFGCDICQEVCPFNYRALKQEQPSVLSSLGEDEGIGPFVAIRDVLELRTDKEFLETFQGTPLMRARREGLLRNALIVAANQGLGELRESIEQVFHREKLEYLKEHAEWALQRI